MGGWNPLVYADGYHLISEWVARSSDFTLMTSSPAVDRSGGGGVSSYCNYWNWKLKANE